MKSIKRIFQYFAPQRRAQDHQLMTEPSLFEQAPPHNLGIHNDIPGLIELVKELESTLDTQWLSEIQRQVIETHHIDNEKYEWLLFELKRFFIISILMKQVNMYSRDVSLIWNEMLSQTSEYEEFCMNFAGQFIHHEPNISGIQETTPDIAEDRALYDLVYSLLFEIHPQNIEIMRPFFRFNVNEEIYVTIQKYPDKFALSQYFNKNTNNTTANIQSHIINQIRAIHKDAKEITKSGELDKLHPALRTKSIEQQRGGAISVNNDPNIDPLSTILMLTIAKNNNPVTAEEITIHLQTTLSTVGSEKNNPDTNHHGQHSAGEDSVGCGFDTDNSVDGGCGDGGGSD